MILIHKIITAWVLIFLKKDIYGKIRLLYYPDETLKKCLFLDRSFQPKL